MQLVKDFTADNTRLEVEYYLCMYPEEEQSFQGLIDHLTAAFQSGETENSLIRDFYNHIPKPKESEDAFADELQILVRKIIARKPQFCLQDNEALKHQYVHKMKDQYYGAIARNYLLTSPKEQSFIQLQGQLALAFGKRDKKDTKAHVTTAAISSESSPGVNRDKHAI